MMGTTAAVLWVAGGGGGGAGGGAVWGAGAPVEVASFCFPFLLAFLPIYTVQVAKDRILLSSWTMTHAAREGNEKLEVASTREHTRQLHVTRYTRGRHVGTQPLYPFHHLIYHFRRLALSPEVWRQTCTLPYHLVHCPLDPVCPFPVSKVAQHERCRTDGRERICNVLSGNIWCRSVDTAKQIQSVATSTTVPTHGSPMTNVSPAFTDGTSPRDPTRAAAASLQCGLSKFGQTLSRSDNPRNDIAVEIWRNHYIVDAIV